MTNLKAVLFDLDGTLLDSKKSVIDAVFYISEKYKPTAFTYEEIEARFGETFDDFLKLFPHENHEEMFRNYAEYMNQHHDSTVSLFPNVKQGLLSLKEQGLKLAIVTNKEKDMTLKGLKLFQIEHLFDALITVDDVKFGKPNPEPIEAALEQLQVHHQEAMMVGDTVFDLEAARAADVMATQLDWYRVGEFSEPSHYFTDFEAFVHFLLKKEEVTHG